METIHSFQSRKSLTFWALARRLRRASFPQANANRHNHHDDHHQHDDDDDHHHIANGHNAAANGDIAAANGDIATANGDSCSVSGLKSSSVSGLVVEWLPATESARVRFPAHALLSAGLPRRQQQCAAAAAGIMQQTSAASCSRRTQVVTGLAC